MTDSQTIDFGADPRVEAVLTRLRTLVPDADTGHLVRAAVLHFGEAVPDHEIVVYVREQMGLAQP
jgi:hypothetical protein